jgi:hypothetical protein
VRLAAVRERFAYFTDNTRASMVNSALPISWPASGPVSWVIWTV